MLRSSSGRDRSRGITASALCFHRKEVGPLFGNRARYGEPVGDTSTDVIVVGAGLAGLVAACELVDRGKESSSSNRKTPPI